MREGVQRIIDALVPPAIASQGRDALRRGRMVAVACAIGALLVAVSALWSWLAGLSPTVVRSNLFWGTVIALIPLFGRRLRSVDVFANALLIAVLAQVALLAIASAGRHLGALYSIAAIPLCAILLSGWRSGLVYSLLCGAVVVSSGFVPEDLLRGIFDWRPDDSPMGAVRDAFVVVMGVGLFAGLYDWTHKAALDESREARRQSEESERRATRSSRLQTAMVDVARRLQAAERDELDGVVVECLGLAADLVDGDRTVLTLFEPSWERMLARHVWHGPGVSDGPHDWSNPRQGFQQFRWMARELRRTGTLAIRDAAELPPEAALDAEQMRDRGVVGWISMRLRAGRWAHGFLTIECHRKGRDWQEDELTSVRLLGEILASAVAHSRAEAALGQSEEKFSRAFASHPEGLVITRLRDDVIVECNESFVRASAFESREAAVGSRITALGSVVGTTSLDRLREQLDGEGGVAEIEIDVPDGPRGARTLLVTARRIEIGDERCALTIFRDVTAHRQLELELRQAQKMDAVGRLAGGIAHDFNNMLTVISGYGEVLLQSVDDDLKSDVECICDAARRSAALTRQLLAFSRRQVLNPKVIDLSELLAGYESMMRPLIGENIAIHYRIEAGTRPVKVDPGQIEQALMNLVINARDAMPGGGDLILGVRTADLTELESAARLGLEPGRYVCLSVTDNGRGMPQDTIDRVLEPFFTTKPEGQGTGLGLATVHGIMLQSGGTIEITSEPGRGTRVDLYLPESHGNVAREHSTAPTRPDESSRGRVLLVEDEYSVRRLVRRALGSGGFEVVEAGDGVEALSLVDADDEGFDLLLTDVVMPRMGGVELAAELRRRRPHLRIAFMSGYPARGGDDEQLLPADVPLISKPFAPGDLCAQVAALLERDSS